MTDVCVILQTGQGDVYFTVVSKQVFDTWPDDKNASQFLDGLEESDWHTEFSILDLLKYLKKNQLNVVGEGFGYIY